jgi:hypothetical protein
MEYPKYLEVPHANQLLRRSGESVLHVLAVPALVLAPASPPANVPVGSLSNGFT